MVTGKLTNGFKFEIAEGAFSDYDYLILATKYKRDLIENLISSNGLVEEGK